MKITVVIPTCYEKNQKYLDLALRSLDQSDYPKELTEIIVVASNGFKPVVNKSVKLFCFSERKHFAEAVNFGFKMAAPDSEMFMILSDDCVLTRSALTRMVCQIGNQGMILGPISNCDNNARYMLKIGFNAPDSFYTFTSRFYRFEDTAPYHDAMINADSLYPAGMLIYDYHCFYAVMIPKRIWNEVGELDEKFKSGQEDHDYCKRAWALGIPTFVALNALIWHFGGVTAEAMLDDKVRKENMTAFNEKWKT